MSYCKSETTSASILKNIISENCTLGCQTGPQSSLSLQTGGVEEEGEGARPQPASSKD
jgi:hypothetical protein